MRDNNSFHVLAKITFDDTRSGLCAAPEQKHFFIHTSDEARAVALAKLALNTFKADNPLTAVQFTVKSAVEIPLVSSTSPQEEVFSI